MATTKPIIIKRKKVIADGGHHGGAWKVAYADFVTAMMAFFMLMWLLNATTEKQRKGIADYFNPTIPVNRVSGGGDGALGGDSVFTEETFANNGSGASQTHAFRAPISTPPRRSGQDDATLAQIEAVLRPDPSSQDDDPRNQIALRQSDEGLVIELFSRPGQPLFDATDNHPTRTLEALVTIVAEATTSIKNSVAIEAHSRAFPAVLAANPAWEITRLRADGVRTLLEQTLPAHRVARLTSHGQMKPVTSMPMDVRNDRIELILLTENN